MAHIYKSPNIILAKTITLCSKFQNYFLAKTYLHILKFLTHGKYKLLISQKYFFLQNLWELCLFFPQSTNYKSSWISPMAKLFILVGMTKPKETQLQSLAKPAQLTYKSQQLKLTRAVQSSFSTTWQLEPITINSSFTNQIRKGHVSSKG